MTHDDTPAPVPGSAADELGDAGRVREVRYEYTPAFVDVLRHLDASLLVTTYQAGKLLVLGVQDRRLEISFCSFEQPMGLAVHPNRLAVGTKRQIHFLVPAHDVAPSIEPRGSYNGCYLPRQSFYTGAVHGHDLAWGAEGLWVVNTLFSCLCTLHDDYSFVPRWRPSFITALADQDRCHLNGLALEDGVPRYVTAMAESDDPAGWRPTKASSGCVIDVTSNDTISRGFAMPHSPRIHDGQLWLLDSGRGSIGIVDRQSGRYEPIEEVPGYTRGLALAGQFAFVGLSKIRETAVFGGIPIAERRETLRCGIAVIDLISGRTVAVFQFHSGVNEIFAVDLLSGITSPMVAGAAVEQQERDVWIVPDPHSSPPIAVAPRWPLFTSPGGLPRAAAEPDSASAAANPPSATSQPIRFGELPGRQLASLALRYHTAGRLKEAAECLERAIPQAGQPASLWVRLGNVRQDQQDAVAAANCYQAAIVSDPSCVAAYQNLGYLSFNQGHLEQAQEAYAQLLRLDPSPLNRLLAASLLPIVYESTEQLAHWRARQCDAMRQLVSDRLTVDATRQLVPTGFYWAYQGCNNRDVMGLRGLIIQGRDLLAEGCSSSHAAAHPRPRSPSRPARKIRIGFLSAYFRDHTIGRLNIGRIEQLDRQRFHVSVISPPATPDSLRQRFEQSADSLVILPRDVAASLQRLVEQELDVLIFADVGMDPLCSTLAYSRVAPIQCATWGHPETTGSPAIDYFVSSELLEAAEAQAHYTERLIRLPSLGTCYDRPARTGPQRGRDGFGLSSDCQLYLCPQTLFKFHPDFDAVLDQILQADRKAVLGIIEGNSAEITGRLKLRWSRTLPHARTARNAEEAAEKRGPTPSLSRRSFEQIPIDRGPTGGGPTGGRSNHFVQRSPEATVEAADSLSRVHFLPLQPNDDFLALLQAADVILDPLHFGGGNSSYEALAMGTPVVTWPSEFLRGRITQALYRQMECDELIADSAEDYVAKAVRVVNDRAFRRHCREQIAARSPRLFNARADIHDWQQFLIEVTN